MLVGEVNKIEKIGELLCSEKVCTNCCGFYIASSKLCLEQRNVVGETASFKNDDAGVVAISTKRFYAEGAFTIGSRPKSDITVVIIG